MIKEKQYKKIVILMMVCMIVLVSIIPIMKSTPTTANAEETQRYTLLGRVAYVSNIPFDNYDGSGYYTTSGMYSDHFVVQMYGTSTHGSANASRGEHFGFDYITIIANISDGRSPHNDAYRFEHIEFELKNNTTNRVVESGDLSGTGFKVLVKEYVPEGEYTLTYKLGGVHSGLGLGSIRYTFTYDFVIDSITPSYSLIAGGDYKPSGSYVNETIRFTGSDNNLDRVYYKRPSSSSFSSTSSSYYSVSATSSNNGWWEFRATDEAGNASNTVKLYMDTKEPVGEVRAGYRTLDSGDYTNRSFSYEAEDETGTVYYEFQRPYSSSWEDYDGGDTISSTASNGWYAFRAYDRAGNYSDEFKVYLDTRDPDGDLYADGAWISNGSTTDADYIVFEADDSRSGIDDVYVKEPNSTSYRRATNGSQYGEEGTYSFYAEDNAGNESDIYTITIDRGPDHEYVVKSTVLPTCTEQGYTIYECTICGDEMNDDFVPALGHSYVKRIVEPTCTTQGYTKHICQDCGHTYNDTYVNGGGHEYETVIIAPTCTEDGYTNHVCKHCGDSFISDILKATGHIYEETQTTVTCTEQGGTKHTCTKCGHSYMTEVIEPQGHKYVSVVTKNATCEESGLRHHRCEVCGDEYENEIPALGHDYEITDITENEDGTTTRTYTCKICNHSYAQELGDQYDQVATYIEDLSEKYSPYMWWVLLGTAGILSIVMGVFYVIAQKNEEKEKARKMLVNYVIGLIAIAVILVACPYLINGIALLISK